MASLPTVLRQSRASRPAEPSAQGLGLLVLGHVSPKAAMSADLTSLGFHGWAPTPSLPRRVIHAFPTAAAVIMDRKCSFAPLRSRAMVGVIGLVVMIHLSQG